MVHGGVCLARLDDGTPLMLDGAIPNELVEVALHHSKGRLWFADTVAVLEASPHRVAAPCPYYGECGGCQLQHVDAAEQLQLKAGIVHDALRRQQVRLETPLRAHAAGEPWRYRWRGEFHVIRGIEGMADARIGFNRRRSWKPIAIDDCLIHHSRITDALPALRELIRDAATPDLATVHLTVGEDGSELLLRARPPRALDGEAIDDRARAGEHRWSTTSTSLRWRGLTFRVSPDTFIQVNWQGMDTLYSLVLAALGDTTGAVLVDAYAGVGVLACVLAQTATSVTCIESNREAARLGVLNAHLNGVGEGLRYVASAVEDALAQEAVAADAVVLDPPRAGCDGRVTGWLALAGPPLVVYVSCDPATLARDLRLLCVSGPYAVEQLDVVDMFAQTHHIESVAVLRRH